MWTQIRARVEKVYVLGCNKSLTKSENEKNHETYTLNTPSRDRENVYFSELLLKKCWTQIITLGIT